MQKYISKHKSAFIFCSLFALFYIFPLLLCNVYYRDDLRRVLNGAGWEWDGRLFSTFFMSKITGGGYITDFFPYGTIFSAIIIAITGYMISYILKLENNNKYRLSGFLLLINPFFLENLSYRWDSLPMAISIICLIIPFLFISSKYIFISLSVLGIYISLLTYQASIVVYPLMALTVLLVYCLDNEKGIGRYILLFLSAFLAGLIIYKFANFIKPLYPQERGETIFFKEDFLLNLQYNFDQTVNLIKTAFSKYFTLLMLTCILLFSFIYIKYNIQRNLLVNKILILVLILSVILFIPLVILALQNKWIGARLLVGFPFFIYMLFIFINRLSDKIVTLLSLLFILISLPLISSYANALKAQNNLETYVAQKIASTVNVEDKQLIFNGRLEYNPEINIAINKFPIIKYLIPSDMTDNMSRSQILFARANNYMYLPRDVSFEEYTEIMKDKERIPIISETYYYILRADSARVIVDFGNSKSKKFKIVVP